MIITPKNRSRKAVIILSAIAVIILIIGAAGYAIIANRSGDTSKMNSTDPTLNSSKQDLIDSTSGSTTAKPGLKSTDTAPKEISIAVTNASQQDTYVAVRAIASGTVSGTCKLTMSKQADLIEREAPLQAQASYTICQGYNIPVSNFPSGGKWNVKVSLTVEGETYESDEVAVEVRK